MGLLQRLRRSLRSGTWGGSWGRADSFRFFDGTFYSTGNDGAGDIRKWMRISPAIAVCLQVYARLLKTAPLELVRPNGEILTWPPKDGRSGNSPGMQVLKLWMDRPNWLQTREQFLDVYANDWVYEGESIGRIFRGGTDVPTEIRLLPAVQVSLTGRVLYSVSLDEEPHRLVYHYNGRTIEADPNRPGVFHTRMNVDPRYQYRGRPPVWNMEYEVKSSALASIYRSEVYRQGGPVRTAIKMSSESRDSTNFEQKQRIADRLAKEMKRTESWTNTVTLLPEDADLADWGPKSQNDEMYVMGSRYVDEKITSAYGVPLLYQGNMENGTYNNSRQQIAVLTESAGSSMFAEIASAIRDCLLRPIGGETAKLHPRFNLAAAQRGELVIWNKVVLDRLAAGVITQNEARLALDFETLDDPEYDKLKDKAAKALQGKAPANDAKGVAKPPADK